MRSPGGVLALVALLGCGCVTPSTTCTECGDSPLPIPAEPEPEPESGSEYEPRTAIYKPKISDEARTACPEALSPGCEIVAFEQLPQAYFAAAPNLGELTPEQLESLPDRVEVDVEFCIEVAGRTDHVRAIGRSTPSAAADLVIRTVGRWRFAYTSELPKSGLCSRTRFVLERE